MCTNPTYAPRRETLAHYLWSWTCRHGIQLVLHETTIHWQWMAADHTDVIPGRMLKWGCHRYKAVHFVFPCQEQASGLLLHSEKWYPTNSPGKDRSMCFERSAALRKWRLEMNNLQVWTHRKTRVWSRNCLYLGRWLRENVTNIPNHGDIIILPYRISTVFFVVACLSVFLKSETK